MLSNVEVKVMIKESMMHATVPHKKIIWSKISIVPRLRSPTLFGGDVLFPRLPRWVLSVGKLLEWRTISEWLHFLFSHHLCYKILSF